MADAYIIGKFEHEIMIDNPDNVRSMHTYVCCQAACLHTCPYACLYTCPYTCLYTCLRMRAFVARAHACSPPPVHRALSSTFIPCQDLWGACVRAQIGTASNWDMERLAGQAARLTWRRCAVVLSLSGVDFLHEMSNILI